MEIIIKKEQELKEVLNKFPPVRGGDLLLVEGEALHGVKYAVKFSLIKGEFYIKFNYPSGLLEGNWEDAYASSILNKLPKGSLFLELLLEEGLEIEIELSKHSYKDAWVYFWRVEPPPKVKNIIKNRITT